MKKARTTKEAKSLGEIPNIGPAMVKDFELLGIKHPADLKKKDPYALYDALCRKTRMRHDPCVIDTFISAVRFMGGAPAKPWWTYTDERKRQMTARAKRK